MADFHFIEDPTTLSIISAVLNLTGPNFAAPYDADAQPFDALAVANEKLTKFDMPGGAIVRSYEDPAKIQSIANVISNVMGHFAGFMSAYALILPIIGVIRGIIEIICALMNPFAVIRAVIRLFVKWIPAFIKLFPPFAGVIMIINAIKLILSVVFYIMSVVIPTIQLIISNIKLLATAFGADGNEQQKEAERTKLNNIIKELLNQLGILGLLAPLLEVIFSILRLVAGLPCKGGKKKKKKGINVDLDLDSSCCDEDVCPDEIRFPPSGTARLIPMNFGELLPLFAFKLIPTGAANKERVYGLEKYHQNIKKQLNSQLDEEINWPTPAGCEDAAMFYVNMTNRRGRSTKVPISGFADVRGSIYLLDPALINFLGSVTFEIEPNWCPLVAFNIIGLGCVPDVEAAKDALDDPGDVSLLEATPEVALPFDYANNLQNDIPRFIQRIQNEIDDVVGRAPPYDNNLSNIEKIQNEMMDYLNKVSSDLVNTLNSILSKVASPRNTEFYVDKNIAKANAVDNALIYVVPRDASGSPISKNLPTGAGVAVELFTNFGTITNQRVDDTTGSIIADITSASAGVATITAKVNNELIQILNEASELVTKTQTVRFVADGDLPTRRVVSKSSPTSKAYTGTNSEREPRR